MTSTEFEYSPEFLDLLAEAREFAEKYGDASVLPIHALRAIASERFGVFQRIFTVLKTDVATLRDSAEVVIASLPRSEGAAPSLRLTEGHELLVRSKQEAQRLEIPVILSEHLLLAIIRMEDPLTKRILSDAGLGIREVFSGVLEVRREYAEADEDAAEIEKSQALPSSALERFGRDLTSLAAQGRLDPVIGRDEKIRELVVVLLRRGKSNPILIGEAGTGKTAICEGLAQRIAARDVPDPLLGTRIVEIDMGALVAGASAPGDFEQRFRKILSEAEDSQGRCILLIDEVHTIMVASGAAVSAADLLKPALARGRIRLIGLTTQAEFKKFMERDKAIARRFDRVDVDEPSVEETIAILRGLRSRLEVFHGVQITEAAIQAATKLSARYVSARFLPDKAIDLLDRVCSERRMELLSLPERLDKQKRGISRLELEFEALKADETPEGRDSRREIDERLGKLRQEYMDARRSWDKSKELFEKRKGLEGKLDSLRKDRESFLRAGLVEKTSHIDREEIPALESERDALRREIEAPEKIGARVDDRIGERDLAAELARTTGIPADSMVTSEEQSRYRRVEEILRQRVIGQDAAIREVSRAIRNMAAGMKKPNRPIGAFLFLGPTGVGKTELAKALAEFMFGDERFMTRIDMSEFVDEKIGVSKLIGSGPGYVGYEEGGVLTEAVRNNPYSLVLFDEVEKANRKVFDLFLQMMDEGTLTDGMGRKVSFANTLIVMTSNIGAQMILDMNDDNRADIIRALDEEILRVFRPELRYRLNNRVVFEHLGAADLRMILDLQIDELGKLLAERRIRFGGIDPGAVEEILAKSLDRRFGARPLIQYLGREVRGRIADAILEGKVSRGDTIRIVLTPEVGIDVTVAERTGDA